MYDPANAGAGWIRRQRSRHGERGNRARTRQYRDVVREGRDVRFCADLDAGHAHAAAAVTDAVDVPSPTAIPSATVTPTDTPSPAPPKRPRRHRRLRRLPRRPRRRPQRQPRRRHRRLRPPQRRRRHPTPVTGASGRERPVAAIPRRSDRRSRRRSSSRKRTTRSSSFWAARRATASRPPIQRCRCRISRSRRSPPVRAAIP